MSEPTRLEVLLAKFEKLSRGTNYCVSVLARRVPYVEGADLADYVTHAFGESPALLRCEPATPYNILTAIGNGLRHIGLSRFPGDAEEDTELPPPFSGDEEQYDYDAGPRAMMRFSNHFCDLISEILAEVERAVQQAVSLGMFDLEFGMCDYLQLRCGPVWWGFACVIVGTGSAQVIVGAGSD